MEYTSVFRLSMLVAIIGYLQGKPDITILNNVNNIACGSMTKVTCTVTSSPFASMYWYVNGKSIRECDVSSCYSTGATVPSNYQLSNVGKIFYLEINPVTFNDNSTISCTDGQMSDSITIFPKTEITNGTLRNETTINGNKVSISVLSNCVEMANGVTFQLTKKKSTEQQFIPDTKHTVTKTINACSNHENPDCGGNMTSRVNITTIVQNDSTGDEYSFMLKITYGGSDSWISLGTYTIANNTPHTSSTTAPLSSQSPIHTTSTTRQMSTSASSTITDITTDKLSTTGSPDKQSATSLNEPFIYLIVGCVVLIVVTISCVVHVGYIIYRKRQKHIKTLDESDAVSQTLDEIEAVSNTESQTYHAIEQQGDLQTDQTTEQL